MSSREKEPCLIMDEVFEKFPIAHTKSSGVNYVF